MNKPKEAVPFNVDFALYKKIDDIPNRSDFLRNAISKELGSVCPLRADMGMLDAVQISHWDAFAANHPLASCEPCKSANISDSRSS